MNKVIAVSLLLVGIVHLLPVTGLLGVERLAELYGVSIVDSNLEVLMRHRAVLFGLLGVFMIYAAFQTPLQTLAILAGTISVVSFIGIALSVGAFNESVRKVLIADVVALVALVVSGGCQFVIRSKQVK